MYSGTKWECVAMNGANRIDKGNGLGSPIIEKRATNSGNVRAHGRNIAVLYDKPPKEKVSDGGIVIASDREPHPIHDLVTGVVQSVGDGGYAGEGPFDDESSKRIVPDAALIGKRVYYQMLNAHPIPLDNGDQIHIIDCEAALAIESVSAE